MIDIKTLRAMAAAGATVDVILAAVEAELVAEGERVQARRAKDAERQRRHRHADSTESRPVTRSHSDGAVSLSSLTSNSKNTESKEVRKKERARKSLLPDDWQPKPTHYAKASAAYVDGKAEDMRNWAKSKAIMRADWDATFHGFLRPREVSRGTTQKSTVTELAFNLADEARELERQAGIVGTADFVRGN